MLVPLLMAIWFGIVAKRSGRNVVLWAIGGAALAFVVGLIVAVLAREVVGRVRLRDYSTYLIVTALISIGLTIAIGAILTRALGGSRGTTHSGRRAESVLMRSEEFHRASSPMGLLAQMRRPQVLMRAVPFSVLWVFPICHALLVVFDRIYRSAILDLGSLRFARGDLCWFVAWSLTGLALAWFLRRLSHGVWITLSFTITAAILRGGATWCFYESMDPFAMGYAPMFWQERMFSILLSQMMSAALWAALFVGMTLLFARRFGLRWWVFLSAACLAVLPDLVASLSTGAFRSETRIALLPLGQGVMAGLVLLVSFYLVARLGVDWAQHSGAADSMDSTGSADESGQEAAPRGTPDGSASAQSGSEGAGRAALQAFCISCLVFLYVVVVKASGARNGGIWDLIAPPLVWLLAMLHVGILHAVLASALGMGSLFLFVRFVSKHLRHAFGRNSVETSILLWLVVYAGILALWAWRAQRTRTARPPAMRAAPPQDDT